MFQDNCSSLGTRSLPDHDRSSPSSSICSASGAGRPESKSGQVSGYETLPVSFSDVPLFNSDDDDDDGGNQTFQCTLAIIKPEVVQLMYKVECVMEQNGFIVKTVCTPTHNLFTQTVVNWGGGQAHFTWRQITTLVEGWPMLEMQNI